MTPNITQSLAEAYHRSIRSIAEAPEHKPVWAGDMKQDYHTLAKHAADATQHAHSVDNPTDHHNFDGEDAHNAAHRFHTMAHSKAVHEKPEMADHHLHAATQHGNRASQIVNKRYNTPGAKHHRWSK